jgi:hypothetical protein
MTANVSVRACGFSATLLAVVCFSGCASTTTSLDSARIEHAIAQSILEEHNLDATVSCPSRIPQQAGHVFTCAALLEVGNYPVTVTETDDGGHVRYSDEQPLVTLDIARVQGAIAASVARERHLNSKVSCPSEVLQRAGLSFRCTAVVVGMVGRSEFLVKETDNAGHVSYEGV